MTAVVCLAVDLVPVLANAPLGGGALPPDGEYLQVKDGRLTVGSERQQYWAATGKCFIFADLNGNDSPEERRTKIERSRRSTDVIVQRLVDLGFNAVRMWPVAPRGIEYVVGDASEADCVDYFLARIKERGFRVWQAGFGNRLGLVSAEAVDLVSDPRTAAGWVEAVAEYNLVKHVNKKGKAKAIDLPQSLARVWDPRLEALYVDRMRENANHFNRHTGLRWADDPVFGIWELSNEEWWMRRMVGGAWQKEPAFFRRELIGNWNEWLGEKYGDTATLSDAWTGLLPGELLDEASMLFVPMAGTVKADMVMNDANPAAREALVGGEQDYAWGDFAPQRARDVIAFLLETQLAHKRRCADAVKTFGKSCRLGVTVFDTGIGYEVQSQDLHQNAGTVAHDAYVNGWGPTFRDPTPDDALSEHRWMLEQLEAEHIAANDGPWTSWLLKPPGISQGVMWLGQNRVEGAPFLVYETQIQQPAKYRANFPLRIAAPASIQDWDWISWHYFSPHDTVGEDNRPWDQALDVTSGSHSQGYHYTYDEVQGAVIREASILLRNAALDPAEAPTRFIFGRQTLTDPASMDYRGSYGVGGFDMLQTTYAHGVRIEIDPNRENDEVIGPVVSFAEQVDHNSYTPTPAITFNWREGYLLIDDPDAAAFAGLLGRYGGRVDFANGVKLEDVTITNPAGMAFPVGEAEKYVTFVPTSDDDSPLNEAKKLSLALVSTSFNPGFEIDTEKFLATGQANGAVRVGGLPVLVARVGATLRADFLSGINYTLRDWHLNEIGAGKLDDKTLIIPDEQPVLIVELE